MCGNLTLAGDAFGIWVSGGERGCWLRDPFEPLTTYRSEDRGIAQQLTDAMNSGGAGQTYIVCVIRKDED